MHPKFYAFSTVLQGKQIDTNIDSVLEQIITVIISFEITPISLIIILGE